MVAQDNAKGSDKMKTLNLNVFKKWFDMAEAGIKKEDYREITPYFCNMFLLSNGEEKTMKFWNWFMREYSIVYSIIGKTVSFKKFDNLIYKNGYARKGKPAPQFEIKSPKIKIDTGNPDWGAKQGVKYFIIDLKKITVREVGK